MTPRGKAISVALVAALAVGVVVLAVVTFGGGDGDDDRRVRAAPGPTTITAVREPSTPVTTPTTPRAPLPPGSAPEGSVASVPPGTVVVAPTPPTQVPDTATGPTSLPGSPPAPTATADPDVTTETVVYSPPDAPRRKGELEVPGGERRTTAIVLVHDGDGTDGHRRDLAAWADAYASAGFVTLSIDHFLFKASTDAPVYPRPERDVKAAVQYLRLHASELGIDPARIVVQGFGNGAHLACQAAVSGDDPYFEGTGHYDDGTSDAANGMIGFSGSYDGIVSDPDRYYGGSADSDDPDVQDRYTRANCVANAASASAPVLLVHGDADEDVPVDVSIAFADALSLEEQDASLVLFEGLGHGFDLDDEGALTAEGQAALAHALAWLEARFPEA